MDPRKLLFFVVAIAAAIGLAMVSVFAIVVGVVIAIAARIAFWAAKPKLAEPVQDEDGMIDITAKGKVL